MKRFKPTLWLSFGLVSLTLAIALTAYVFGFMPDGYKAELESRAKVAESIAVQLAQAVNRKDTITLQETINSIVMRNEDIHSSALRNSKGKIILSAGDHDKHWLITDSGKSTPTHVSVPLLGAKGPQGSIEIVFGPASSGKRFFGIPASLLLFLGFLSSAGFIGYFLMLRRTLKELDPGRVIPERVQKSFDTLSESVIILDEHERILLINKAFAKIYTLEDGEILGKKLSHLSWRMIDGAAKAGAYPWHEAFKKNTETIEGAVSLRTPTGKIHNFNITATVIAGEKNKTIGAIVTMRDMTSSNRNKEDLVKAISDLKTLQNEASRQNRELIYLANHDALTGCLNRRAFFGGFQTEIDQAPDLGTPIHVMMVRFDQFKHINDSKGPAASDTLLIKVSGILKAECTENTLISRHTNDSFCIAMVGMNEVDSDKFAEHLQKEISDSSRQLLPGGMTATLSIGITHRLSGSCTAHNMAHRADQALKISSESGENLITHWENDPESNNNNSENLVASTPSKQSNKKKPMFPANHGEAVRSLTKSEEDSLALSQARSDFFAKVENSIQRAKENDKPHALLHMSLVSWEYLGEALGDMMRQKLMRGVKQRVASTLRENDGVLVLGDNGEWLVELNDLDSKKDVDWIVKRILGAFSEPISIENQPIYLTCKIGIALFPQDGIIVSDLARNARIAMRRAVKEHILEGFKYYSPDMTTISSDRLNAESGIRHALKHDEFELYFQPIIEAQSGSVTSVEALLRCNNSQLKEIGIATVIAVAEKSSLIAEIDLWVLKNTLKQMQQWQDAGLDLPKVSINLSAKQLNNVDFMDLVIELIKAVKFSPSRVQIEVTETAKVGNVEIAAPQIKRLQQLGVHIALDDFGTGQASLSYLQRLHPDVLKIDRSFIHDVNINHTNATLVSSMIVMAHCLGLTVVAEGVETEDQLDFLRKTNCDEIQGFLISRPMPAAMVSEWMERYSKKQTTEEFSVEIKSIEKQQAA